MLTKECGCKGQVLEEVGVHMCVRLCPGAPTPVRRPRRLEGRMDELSE